MLAHDIAILLAIFARHIFRDTRDVCVDESDDGDGFLTMHELIANQRNNAVLRLGVVSVPSTVGDELIDEEKFSPETLVELEAEESEEE